MKKHIIPIIIIAILAVVNIGLAIYVYAIFSEPQHEMPESNLTVVTAPAQEEDMTLEVKEVEFTPVIPEGVNVAYKGVCSSGGNQDIYLANKAVDGDATGKSYWEGAAGVWPNYLTVDCGDIYPIYCLKVSLNPATIWSKRTQEFSVEVSTDGENYQEIAANQVYQFDPATGNYVIVDFDEVSARYVKLTFKSNSGATGPQVAELEVFSKIKK